MGKSNLQNSNHIFLTQNNKKWVESFVANVKAPAVSLPPSPPGERVLLNSDPSTLPKDTVTSKVSSKTSFTGRGAPLARVQFNDPYKYRKKTETIVCPEGIRTGQFIHCGKKAQLNIGNILPIGQMPEGTVMCSLEEKAGDRGKIATASGGYCTIVAHNTDTGRT